MRAIESLYLSAGFTITDLTAEAESSEYGAHRFRLNKMKVVFRIAKTTPTKIGQFVTLWKRPAPGETPAALHADDGVSFVVVHVSDSAHRGQFIFSQASLIAKGIMATDKSRGKTAFRVYPPWTTPIAKDAIKTQAWQLKFFLPMDEAGKANLESLRKLFHTELRRD